MPRTHERNRKHTSPSSRGKNSTKNRGKTQKKGRQGAQHDELNPIAAAVGKRLVFRNPFASDWAEKNPPEGLVIGFPSGHAVVEASGEEDAYHLDAQGFLREGVTPDELKVGQKMAIKKPTGAPVTTPVNGASLHQDMPTGRPFSEEKTPGFVVNIPAGTGSVRGDLAAPYFTTAWSDPEVEGAVYRTGVVVGVNAFRSLDHKKGPKAVREAVATIEKPQAGALDVFGYTWEPQWYRGDSSIAFDKVQAEYFKLPTGRRAEALEASEGATRWRADEALPYGIFREEVTAHASSQAQHQALAATNDPVYLYLQDPDAKGFQTPSGEGILSRFDAVLDEMKQQPLLVIGGYNFEGLEAGPDASLEEVQLTKLANEVDRAIRAAIGEVLPEMLYPTEPNLLIDAEAVYSSELFNEDGELEEKGSLMGVGPSEGRNLRKNLKATMGEEFTETSVQWAKDSSIPTDALPQNKARGLTIHEGTVETAVKEHQKGSYALQLQSQNAASYRNLNNEFLHTQELGGDQNWMNNRSKKQFKVIGDLVELMRKSPNMELAAFKEALGGLLKKLDQNTATAKKAAQKAQKGPQVLAAIATLDRVVKGISEALTSEALAQTWVDIDGALTALGG